MNVSSLSAARQSLDIGERQFTQCKHALSTLQKHTTGLSFAEVVFEEACSFMPRNGVY
jgi:hypothetical protein